MLLKFSLKNHKSFRNKAELALGASAIKEYKDNLITIDNKSEIVKSAVIFGANASGKTSFVDGLGFMKSFVTKISPNLTSSDNINVSPFKVDDSASSFEVVFIHNTIKYIYGFELTSQSVKSEWLIFYPKSHPVVLFDRKGKKIQVGKQFKKAAKYTGDTRANALFLSVADKWGESSAKEVIEWFTTYLIVI